MNKLKVMLVEDGADDLESYRAKIKVYEREKSRIIETVGAKTVDEARSKLDNTFDGAIVDLKLAGDGDAGNTIIEEIQKKYRIPIAVLTARPADLRESAIIKAYKKGERGYDEIIDDLFSIYDTGITKIMGGRGAIEEAMNKIFWRNILPKVDAWKNHRAGGQATEAALLRFVIAHLYEVIDSDIAKYFPEEMYIHPPINVNLVTGSIVRQKEKNNYFVVLSPACDLAKHNGNMKTDRILSCAIEKFSSGIIKKAISDLKGTGEEKAKATQILDKIPRNGYCDYFHYLPKVEYFEGGVVNFRKVNSYKPSEFATSFDKPELQIASPFIKDVIARFSSFYARQGQPDFDFEKMTANLMAHCQ